MDILLGYSFNFSDITFLGKRVEDLVIGVAAKYGGGAALVASVRVWLDLEPALHTYDDSADQKLSYGAVLPIKPNFPTDPRDLMTAEKTARIMQAIADVTEALTIALDKIALKLGVPTSKTIH